MAKDNLELAKWGDGTTRLTFWDSLHGDDQIYTLYSTGAVCKNPGTNKAQWLDAAGFVAELRSLADEWHEQEIRHQACHAVVYFLYYWWKKAREKK